MQLLIIISIQSHFGGAEYFSHYYYLHRLHQMSKNVDPLRNTVNTIHRGFSLSLWLQDVFAVWRVPLDLWPLGCSDRAVELLAEKQRRKTPK